MGGLEFQPVNNVELCGRVSSAPSERELPSGDVVLELRLVVPRIDRSGVDTLDLAFWKAGLRRRARNLGVGDVIRVTGALRRRFWQGSAGVTSRSQVEVTGLVKVI
jgi:single-strand DNA-binding protein